MSAQTQNTNLNPYSNTPIKNLEYIQNKALVIAPFEITKSGKLDPDLLLDTPGIININLYKKMVSGEDKEPTPDQFKTIKYISEIDSSNRISSFDIPVIFKYDKETNTRIIEKDLKNLSLDYIDLIIDIENVDFSSETGSGGFYCICCVQKIQKPVATTAFNEVSNEDFLFMIPSIECKELNIDSEFDILDINNKVINLKKCDPNINILFNNQQIDMSKIPDFFNDKSNVATYLFNDNLNDENGLYNASGTSYYYETGIFGKAIKFNSYSTSRVSAPLPPDTTGVSMWFSISYSSNGVIPNLFSANKNNEIFRILPSVADGRIYITNKTAGTKLYRVNIQLSYNTLYHIYMDNTKSGIYLNGIFYPVASVASFAFNRISTLNTFTLSSLTANDNFIIGSIEQLRLFNRALTENEIKYLYLNSPTSIILNSSVDISRVELTASVSIEDQSQFIIKDYETNDVLTSSVTLSEQIANEPDIFNDKSNVATYLFNDNLNDENGLYNASGSVSYIYETGKFGKALFSNNSNTSINLGIPHKSSDILVVSLWLKWSGINKSVPISLGNSGTGLGQSLYFWNGIVGITSNNMDITGFSSSGLSGVWKHFVVEFNSGKVGKIWLDGVKQNLNSTNGTFYAYHAVVSNTPVYIGIPSYGAFGSIDQVRLFNRALTPKEILYLQKETKKITYNIEIPQLTKKLTIETTQGVNYITAKTWTPQDPNIPWYRIHPIINIPEVSSSPKYYLGSKYQRNLMEVLTPALKSKRPIYNLKDMYLVDDLCIQTLKKINILLENNQMIKFTERLYNLDTPLTPIREKLNADLILEYLSTPVSGSSDNDLEVTLKTSLIEDYNFTQEEIDNLNNNLNAFKSRARIALATPTIDNDKFRFNLPKTFIDGNRSKTEKKNLLVFGTNSGFDKFNLTGYSASYSNISKRDTSEVLDYDNLTLGLTTLSSLEDISTINDFQMSYGDETQHILFENGNLYACRYVNPSDSYQYNRDGGGFTKQSFPLKLINTNVKSMYCGMFATFIIDNNNDTWALGGYSISGTSMANPDYDIYGINSSGNHLPNWTKVFNSTPENTPKKVVGTYTTTWLLMENGELFCTGSIQKYYTFDGIQKYAKTWISLATGVADVDCGNVHIVYTMQNGEVYVGDSSNEKGVTTQSSNSTAANPKVLKILTDWIPINQTIIQIECTVENNYYLLSNGDVYGVGMSRARQLGVHPTDRGKYKPIKLYTGVKRIIPQLFGMNSSGSVSMVELITGEIKCMGSTNDYKFGYFEGSDVTTPITLYPKVDKIFLTENNILAIIDGKIFNSGWNRFSGTNLTNQTITEQFLNIVVSKNFEDILTNYKQQIPFTYIPLSTDIKDINDKPVFETLTDITGFVHSDIVIDIPNVL